MIPLQDQSRPRGFPIATLLLIAGNGYVFFLEVQSAHAHKLMSFISQWAIVPQTLTQAPLSEGTTLVSAMFLHAGWMHLIGNMLYLFVFGPSLEILFGRFKFLVFYFLIGVLSNGIQALLYAHSSTPLLGASGAISGVLGAYFYFFPFSRILTLIPIFIFFRMAQVPAFIFLGIWFLLQAFNSLASLSPTIAASSGGGGIAWWAHASGFVAGMLLSPLFSRKIRR